MLTSVRLDRDGEEIHFALDPSTANTNFGLKEVKGLEPVRADVNYADYATIVGGHYSSSNVGARNIVLTAFFEPDWSSGETVEAMRRRVYSLASPGEEVRFMIFVDNQSQMFINGIVESNEPDMFTRDPSMTISIICPEPYFRGMNTRVIEGAAETTTTISYEGDVSRGYEIRIKLLSSVEWVQVGRLSTEPRFRVGVPESIAGNIVVIQGTDMYKNIVLRTSSDVFKRQLIGDISTGLNDGWPQLTPGNNPIRVLASDGRPHPWTITFRDLYRGF